jgi:hypothetical protein
VGELNGYLGAPLVAVVLFTAVRWWRSGVVRVAFLTGLVMLVLSMGERLHVNGQILDAGLPWAAMRSLPLIENVIPTRLLTANLFFALLLAIFADRARRWVIGGRLVAMLVVGAVLVALLPDVPRHAEPLRPPPFFTGPAVRRIPEAASPWWRRSRPPRRPGP